MDEPGYDDLVSTLQRMEELAIVQIRNPQMRKLEEFPKAENFIRYQNGVLDTIDEVRKLFINARLALQKAAEKKQNEAENKS